MNRRAVIRHGLRALVVLCLLVAATRLGEEAGRQAGGAAGQQAAGQAPEPGLRPEPSGDDPRSGAEAEQQELERLAQQQVAQEAMRRIEGAYREGQQAYEAWRASQGGPEDLRDGSRYRQPLTEALRSIDEAADSLPHELRPRGDSMRNDLHGKLNEIETAAATGDFR
jgi:hypothetical protein